MSERIIDIITSPEARRMLQMVTKGFYDRSALALWIFEVIGREYADMAEWAQTVHNEAFPQTCTWSMSVWERLYGFEPDDSLPLEFRRQRIMAKIIAAAPMNPEVIRRGVVMLTGADIEVVESAAPYTFEIIINPSGVQIDYSELRRYIQEIKPSHLSIVSEIPVTVQANINYKSAAVQAGTIISEVKVKL